MSNCQKRFLSNFHPEASIRGDCKNDFCSEIEAYENVESVSDRLASLVKHMTGVTILTTGQLEAPEDNHPIGTEYFVIQANCINTIEQCQDILSPIGRIPTAKWRGTWSPSKSNGQFVFEKKIYPDSDSLDLVEISF